METVLHYNSVGFRIVSLSYLNWMSCDWFLINFNKTQSETVMNCQLPELSEIYA